MLKRVMNDCKIISLAGKTVRCLDVVKAAICFAAFAFAAYESVVMIQAKK